MGAALFFGLMDTSITQSRPGGELPYNGKQLTRRSLDAHLLQREKTHSGRYRGSSPL
jgi:hypothetical protein